MEQNRPTKEEAEAFMKDIREVCAKHKMDLMPTIIPQFEIVKRPSEIVTPK